MEPGPEVQGLLEIGDWFAIALITLVFAGLWFTGGGEVVVRPRSVPKALAAGPGSGVTTMVAHSGGPPLALYLLRLGLPKEQYAGTTSIFFALGNLLKFIPWLWVTRTSSELWWLMAISLPVIPLGVWLGWRLHEKLDERQLYRLCYAMLVVTALKLLPDYARSSSRSGGLAKAALFPGSRASLPADGARSVAFASLPRAGSPRSQEADGPSCRSPDENRA